MQKINHHIIIDNLLFIKELMYKYRFIKESAAAVDREIFVTTTVDSSNWLRTILFTVNGANGTFGEPPEGYTIASINDHRYASGYDATLHIFNFNFSKHKKIDNVYFTSGFVNYIQSTQNFKYAKQINELLNNM